MASKVPLPMPSRNELHLNYNKPMTYTQLAQHYGVSISTIHRWMKNHRIRPRGRAELVEIRGIKHKRCYGPLHPVGGELVPLTKFHKNAGKNYNVISRCVKCRGINSHVPFTPTYQAWVESIYRRLGYSETRRRLGIDYVTLTIWLQRGNPPPRPRPATIRRKHAEAIVKLLAELRLTGEVRHRKSIRRGASLRGEIERPVSRSADLLVRDGDHETSMKKKYRENNPDYVKRQSELRRQRRLRESEAA